MNIDLELYKVFYVVAKNKHMTKASEELHISQPAISQSIKKLENQLGGTLFLRSNKGMQLTNDLVRDIFWLLMQDFLYA